MKAKALTLLFIFMSFILLPTVVSSVCDDVDVSMAFTFTEEEKDTHKCKFEVLKEFIADFNTIDIPYFNIILENISEEFLLKHDNTGSEIFLPPPEQILV